MPQILPPARGAPGAALDLASAGGPHVAHGVNRPLAPALAIMHMQIMPTDQLHFFFAGAVPGRGAAGSFRYAWNASYRWLPPRPLFPSGRLIRAVGGSGLSYLR